MLKKYFKHVFICLAIYQNIALKAGDFKKASNNSTHAIVVIIIDILFFDLNTKNVDTITVTNDAMTKMAVIAVNIPRTDKIQETKETYPPRQFVDPSLFHYLNSYSFSKKLIIYYKYLLYIQYK